MLDINKMIKVYCIKSDTYFLSASKDGEQYSIYKTLRFI